MKICPLIFVSMLAALSASAQTPSPGLTARVTATTGAVSPGAIIKVTNLDTDISRQTVSNETGDFVIPCLNPARYTLEAQAPGFRTYKHQDFTVAVNQILRIDVRLEVGTTSETMTVTETPTLLNTESSARGEVTNKDEIAELPLDGRNFSDLALLTGSVIPRGDGGDGSFAVNGARADNGGFLLDGMNNTQRRNTGVVINPPIESIQEFKMLTSGYSAEYGRYAGGMLTAVTKSGTNRFHGSLHEFIRNDVLDAKGYFDPERLKLRRNQFGATVSGPVVLPKIYNGSSRSFFLFSWDALREINGNAERALVPTPEMLRGDFSKASDASGRPLVIMDTVNRVPFPNSRIPADRFDPVAVKLLQYFPMPNFSGGPYNFVTQGDATNSFNSFAVKLDHTLLDKDRLTVGAFWRTRDTMNPIVSNRSPVPYFGSSNTPGEALTYIRYLHIITPTMYLEASADFSRRTNREVWPHSADNDNWTRQTGFNGVTDNPVAAGPPYITLTGYMPIGPAYDIPKIWTFNNYQYTSALTWIRGAHAFKFGGDFF